MGWWEAPEEHKTVLGDDVLDLVRHFLKDFSQNYQNALTRKPTLEELQYVLSLGLRVNVDDDILADFEEKEIKQVILKESKRSKRQKPKPGDIFCFRLDETQFGFGRIVSQIFIGLVVEIFDYFSKQPVFDYSRLGQRLIDPIIIDGFSLFERMLEGDWRIIGSISDYTPGEELQKFRFVFGDPVLRAVDIFNNRNPISPKDAEGLPRCSLFGDFHVKELVKEALAKKG